MYTRRPPLGLGETRQAVLDFYLQDISSDISAGKNDTITRNGVKMQKRYLCETMFNLHERFRYENPSLKVPYNSFARIRPFYVVEPSVSGRNTVLCHLHTKCELKAFKLHQMGVIVYRNLTSIMSSIAYSIREKDCMYLNCNVNEKAKSSVCTGLIRGRTAKMM